MKEFDKPKESFVGVNQKRTLTSRAYQFDGTLLSLPGAPMWRILLVSIAFLSLVGCGSKGGKHVVSGKITYKGNPVNGALLRLIPVADKGQESTIPVGQDGTFQTTGIQPGEYKVVVQPGGSSSGLPNMKELEHMDASKREAAKANLERMKQEQQNTKPTIPFPDKYKTHITSDLRLNVGKEGAQTNFELKD